MLERVRRSIVYLLVWSLVISLTAIVRDRILL